MSLLHTPCLWGAVFASSRLLLLVMAIGDWTIRYLQMQSKCNANVQPPVYHPISINLIHTVHKLFQGDLLYWQLHSLASCECGMAHFWDNCNSFNSSSPRLSISSCWCSCVSKFRATKCHKPPGISQHLSASTNQSWGGNKGRREMVPPRPKKTISQDGICCNMLQLGKRNWMPRASLINWCHLKHGSLWLVMARSLCAWKPSEAVQCHAPLERPTPFESASQAPHENKMRRTSQNGVEI